MKEQARRVPALVTLDVHEMPGIDRYIARSVEMLDEMGIPATYFVPAVIFQQYSGRMRNIPKHHQIASHGLFHSGDEDYSTMSYETQKDYIERQTKILSDGLGQHPGAFRAPGFRISGGTLSLLEKNDYYADVSVNAGRLGITSTYNRENGWFRAERIPYHPDESDPFHPGRLSLWEIPVSAFLLPFTSNAVVTLGSALTKVLAGGLLGECRKKPKPMVYMSHPEDLNENGPERQRPKFKLEMLLPVRGFSIRHYVSTKPAKTVYEINCKVLGYLRKQEAIEFVTVENYVRRYLPSGAQNELAKV